MRPIALVISLLAALAAGCTHNYERDATGNPRTERLSPEELARAQPQRPRPMGIEELVRLSRTTPPEELIKQYYQSGTRLKLTQAQVTDMRNRGVDARVIDHIVTSEVEAEKIDRITNEVDRERAIRQRQDHYRGLGYPTPYYPSPYYAPRVRPYGGYGWGPRGSGWSTGIGIGF
jgi:hypothetical protein